MEINVRGILYSGYSDKDQVYKPLQDSIPASFCLADLGSVKDQGSTPWCSAYAACDALEYQFRCTGKRVDLNERDLYGKRFNDGEGMQPRDTFNILLTQGVACRNTHYFISSYARIFEVDDIKRAIMCNGPVYLALPVRSMISKTFWKGSNDLGGHAIVAVGWNEEGLLLKNSYGYNWGDNGYVRMPYADKHSIQEAWTFVAKVI